MRLGRKDVTNTSWDEPLHGVLAFGRTRDEAIGRVQVLSLRVLADRLDHGEAIPEMSSVFAVTQARLDVLRG